VGLGLKPPVYLKDGDVMRLEVEGLGYQQQKVVSHAPKVVSVSETGA
jgi:2-keto-4-pentenoate hydratase/2-oxohepta-3-ene-1,7-dioic acid hydratase in catechol pathway